MDNMQITAKCTCKCLPLTIDAIIELAQEIDWPAGAYIDFARAIESAHGIKEEA